MKRVFKIFLVINFLSIGLVMGQSPEMQEFNSNVAPGIEGYDEPEYLVTYEVIPSLINSNCNFPKNNTIIFEIPTTEEYYNCIKLNQEVTTWFKVFGSDNEALSGNFMDKNKERWKLVIRGKRIMSKEIE